MCGIAGFVGADNLVRGPERAAVLERMCRIIRHRGPDDQGTLLTEDVALGMRRLAIIDLAGGHQPLSGCDDALSIVFNGEIYNFQELQPELEARGHRFRTHSDTEAIVHAYEEFGESCVEHLRGMFAFALWDGRARKLFVARDRAGKKPLYYTTTPQGVFLFASELKSLLEYPSVGRETSAEALDAYLTFGYVPDPLSIFQGIRKLPPAHSLTFDGREVAVKQYWDLPFETDRTRRRVEDYLEELRALLDESVRLRLMSDVPLGAFLSGGVDSSAVVGLMARHMSQPVKTFSIGFQEDSYNELKYARVAAKHFATDHHEFIVTPDICDIVDELVWHFDEPFADSSAIPTYMVSKLARQFVTVALSGDGGDELFAGYTRYVIDRQRSGFARLPRMLRRGVMQPLSRHLPHAAWGRNFLHNVALDPLDRYIDSVSVFTSLNKRSLYTDDFRRSLNGQTDGAVAQFRDYAARVRTGDPLDSLLYLDSKTYLPGDILTKVDRMSMAVSLEARGPLLDHKLMEFVARIPAPLKLHGLETKHIFKRALEGLVPAEILHRPKQGFGVPIDQWINRQLRARIRETLTERRTLERGLVEPRYVRTLLDEHERGRRDHATPLWTLLMLELWHRTFADAPRGSDGAAQSPAGNLVPVAV
ncbi:MAG TPA: asparagine synthase (glutamine-hydrolyzing) [Pyrinomonadaceae bacterium]|jgi:asparagine synthase (glutamine-hydrolysing)|nr:asparagine synthase (glutamine-hydrolyzing) [Pyrinomonadaceae bacterium]